VEQCCCLLIYLDLRFQSCPENISGGAACAYLSYVGMSRCIRIYLSVCPCIRITYPVRTHVQTHVLDLEARLGAVTIFGCQYGHTHAFRDSSTTIALVFRAVITSLVSKLITETYCQPTQTEFYGYEPTDSTNCIYTVVSASRKNVLFNPGKV
jgi:hypothetical protein